MQRHRADWYTSRGLATVVAEEPYHTVQLTFEPKGNGHEGELFYLVDKENKCVCCGEGQDLTGHHIVPICFRRWFPLGLKGRDSHDIIILCPECHDKYEHIAWRLKQKLFEEATGKTHEEIHEDERHEQHVVSAAVALCQWGDRIPADRQEVLRARIAAFLGHPPADQDLVDLAARRRKKRKHRDPLARKVVETLDDFKGFIRMWRQHFIETMQPQYLPPHWSVDHRM